MPPKDNITLGPGTLFFNGPEGVQPLGEVQEVEITEETELDVLGEEPRTIVPMRTEFSASITVPAETLERLIEAEKRVRFLAYWAELCERYPNRRVVHLATHHGNPRTRIKNMKRIFRYYNIKV
jgi:hypothetical protein